MAVLAIPLRASSHLVRHREAGVTGLVHGAGGCLDRDGEATEVTVRVAQRLGELRARSGAEQVGRLLCPQERVLDGADVGEEPLELLGRPDLPQGAGEGRLRGLGAHARAREQVEEAVRILEVEVGGLERGSQPREQALVVGDAAAVALVRLDEHVHDARRVLRSQAPGIEHVVEGEHGIGRLLARRLREPQEALGLPLGHLAGQAEVGPDLREGRADLGDGLEVASRHRVDRRACALGLVGAGAGLPREGCRGLVELELTGGQTLEARAEGGPEAGPRVAPTFAAESVP